MNFFYKLYAKVFSKSFLYSFNKIIYHLGLRGLGVLNYSSDKISGEASFLIKYISENQSGVVLDVGANIGKYSETIRRINSKIDIYSFEPHPVTYKKLIYNLDGLNINCLNLGVGSVSGTLELHDYANQDGSPHASVYQDVIKAIHKEDTIKHRIDVINLDDFVIKYDINAIHLLKIDTEGHELEVLRGFENFIKANKVSIIHFEFNEMNVISRVFFKDFWDFLPNYNFYRMLPNGLIHIKYYSPILCEIFSYQNIVAILKK